MPELGLIVPVRDHWDYVIRTVDTAFRQTPDVLVIVVDDASSTWRDDVPARLASLGPPGRLLVHRFREHGGLTRSWNVGLRHCRDRGCEHAAPANSDLAFSPGWWPALRDALATATFAGPLSNAPGHQLEQDVRQFLPTYETDDTDDALAATAAKLRATFGGRSAPPRKRALNGFLVAGRTASFWSLALRPDAVYDPSIPFDGNEDDFHRRALAQGRTLAIAHASFVFHYKGVSRDTTPRVRPHKQDRRPGHRAAALRTLDDLPLAPDPIVVFD